MTAVVVAGAAVHDAALDTLARGSRTFWLASLFLPTDRRLDAAVLYALCRRVDDTADDAASPTEAWAGLAALDAWIDRGGDPTCDAAREVMARRRIDPQLAHELVEGVRSDTGLVRVANDRELLRYCYRVASTVGLMMCGVLGVTDPAALPFAIDLGVAMQLTNIARDVAEDARLGRVYLPADRLRALGAGVEPAEVLASREPVRRVVADLLALADRYYASADHGMRAIPWRARLAVVLASRVYRAIGVRLLRRGGDPLAGRTVVPRLEQLAWAAVAVVGWLRSPGWRRPHDAALHVHLAGLPGAHAPGEG